MGARTSGREAALQALYALDGGSPSRDDVERAIKDYWRELPGDVEGREYADVLIRGAAGARDLVDGLIKGASRHWRLERMARVDRNILRLGVFELRDCRDVPRAVVIDEAVELAKRYGAEGSSVFVNGVLDRIADDLKR